jgi:DNA-binding response OmpR family regulator
MEKKPIGHAEMTRDEPTLAPFRVLVVEDDPFTGKALRRLFTRKGWDVTVAMSIADAMKSLTPPPHFILLDLMLPDGDGEDVLRKVRDEGIPSRVGVCSGTNDSARLAMVKNLGPDAMFQKPINFDVLCRFIEGETKM